ncbi:YadA-like family protein [Achromobacter xylosoxidans]|uniref:YadA-like family protein n=6 Tax=Alcaligenes xylosoxydans xylosoxydans TaxID=85698 RepID=UPI0012DE76E4|nr:YadA-like family protein [Achromobacter xylosoxidans]
MLGLKRRKGLGLALLGGLGMALVPCAPAQAANGIFINARATGNCLSINDPEPSIFPPTQSQLERQNLNTNDGHVWCRDGLLGQTLYVLFYRPSNVAGEGTTSLTLGGDLMVNGGWIKLGDNTTGLVIGNPASRAATAGTGIVIGDEGGAGSFSVAVGAQGAVASGEKATAVGNTARATAANASALGGGIQALAVGSSSIGVSTTVRGENATGVGRFAQVPGAQGLGLGRSTIVRGANSAALGMAATTANDLSVALGAGSATADSKVPEAVNLNGKSYSFDSTNMSGPVSIGSPVRKRQLLNVAPGGVSEFSTDAVNGAQLFASQDALVFQTASDRAQQVALAGNQDGLASARGRQTVSMDSFARIIGNGAGVSQDGRIVMLAQTTSEAAPGQASPSGILGELGALDRAALASDKKLGEAFDLTFDAHQKASENAAKLEGLGADEKVVDRIDEVRRNALMWDPSQKTYSATHADGAQNRISNVAAGVASTDAVNKGQLDGVGQAAADAQQAAAGAQRTADAAQGAATGALQAVPTAQAAATAAGQAAETANVAAGQAQRKADAADAKLAGIGDGETVAGKIDQAVQAAADKSDRNAGEALAAALGGGSTVGADGKASAPAYAVSQVGGDGAVTAPAPATTVGAAVAALDANVLKVNERVSAQGNDLDVLKQDVGNLRDDSLLWDAGAGAFSAAHGGTAPNRIVDVAAGQAETDAVNKGQLDGVAQTATAARTTADEALKASARAEDAAISVRDVAERTQAILVESDHAATDAQATAAAARRTADAARGTALDAQGLADGARRNAAETEETGLAAQASADAARQAAATASQAAAGAQQSADNGAQAASTALEAAGQAVAMSQEARRAAEGVAAKLEGIGEGETVVGRIDAAAKAAADTAAREAGQSLAVALGGGAVVGQDGKAGAPSYAVSQVGPDGAVAPQSQTVNNVGAAVAALDANVLKVNDRVRAQGDALSTLTQDLEGLRDDSLLWDQGAGAFSATRGGEPANRIVNLAAGQATTDAVNKGQLDEAVAQLKAQGAGLLQEADGQLQVGRGADATVVNLAGAAPQRDAQGNPVMDADGNVVTAATDRTLTGVADGKAANDAANKGQLDTVAGTATAASEAAASAQQAANAAQAAAAGGRQLAFAADRAANDAQQLVDAAQLDTDQARHVVQSVTGKLAGLGPGESVAARIDAAADGTGDAVRQATAQSQADALGGGATVGPDGRSTAPSYAISEIGNDGGVADTSQSVNNVAAALSGIDANTVGVNARASALGDNLSVLTQDVSDLRGDSLQWDRDAGLFSAARDGTPANRIGNLAAGQSGTDAVNVGQLESVASNAQHAQRDADEAQRTADAAQGTAVQAQQSAQSAQGAAAAAQGAADAANAKLAGIGEGETVIGRIGDATRAANQALADALGGGAGVGADGTVQGPAFAVTAVGPDGRGQASSQGNVADALRVVDGSVVAVNDKVNAVGAGVETMREQLDAGQLGLVRQDAGTRDIAVAGQTDGARVTFSGTGGARTLDGVKAGAVSQASSEVVVGSQLFSVNQDVLRNSEAVGDLEALTGRQGVALTALSDRVDSGNVGLTRHDPSSNTVSVAADRGGQVVDLAGTDGARQVTGLREGRIQAGSTDAVTGGQVNTLTDRVNQLDAQGTSVAIDSQGDGSDRAVVAPGSRAVAVGSNAQATGANAVATGAGAEARGAGSAALGAGAKAQASGSVAVGANAAATAPGSVALGEGAQATRANTVSVGTTGAERQITNVAAATHDTDAVNLRQAIRTSRQAAQQAAREARRHTDNRVAQLRRDNNAGVASAMAMAALPSTSSPGKSMFAVGAATYDSQSAVAMGVSARSRSGAWVYRMSFSGSTAGQTGASVGVTFAW